MRRGLWQRAPSGDTARQARRRQRIRRGASTYTWLSSMPTNGIFDLRSCARCTQVARRAKGQTAQDAKGRTNNQTRVGATWYTLAGCEGQAGVWRGARMRHETYDIVVVVVVGMIKLYTVAGRWCGGAVLAYFYSRPWWHTHLMPRASHHAHTRARAGGGWGWGWKGGHHRRRIHLTKGGGCWLREASAKLPNVRSPTPPGTESLDSRTSPPGFFLAQRSCALGWLAASTSVSLS